MEKSKILDFLDETDIFMLNNLNEENSFDNVNDMQVRMMAGQLQKINQEMKETGEKGILQERASTLYKAFKLAMGKPNQNSNLVAEQTYFDYVKDTRKLFEKGINSPDEALSIIINALNTRNVPEEYAITYMMAQNENNMLKAEQKEMFDELIPMIDKIADKEKQIRNEKNEKMQRTENALTVRKEKKSIFKKIEAFINKITGKSNRKNKEVKKYSQNENISSKNNFREDVKVENSPIIPNNFAEQEPEYIVISDLHGNMERWEDVKRAMRESPNMRVIMLGDAMDREKYGPEILLQIKELSDQGRLEYIPGNHDKFAYDYLKAPKNTSSYRMAKIHLERNHGEITMNKLDNFNEIVKTELRKGNIENNISVQELANWLGKQPIQKKMSTNEEKYALAHAIFDEKLYNYDKDFNLEKALSLELENGTENEVYSRFENCIWYREFDERTHYSDISYPENYVVIVGHTPQRDVNLRECFQGDPKKALICIDTGNGEFSGFNLSKNESVKFQEQIER